ncbi:fuculose phosphate aldolase [Novimethylophilus kurashikiensis]|uniref:Fuculose phosphate aldolase n=1 Tax=Novimethylophilus kurashikiensis TaxID=1825523 RepID=A0A2R5FBB5_9PROT|nr:hypothetical protein [Novimethylophilus kurashikiensis]GBG14838.1 fuculose phosphate aldolase [Novimethylophilus kurashikiensis]
MSVTSKSAVRTAEQALAYLTDCNLATVASMAMKKTRLKYEFERQIMIAQSAVSWMVEMHVDFSGTRAEEVVTAFGGSVSAWAQKYQPK